ncbi:MAG TPA: hypothetical protein VFM18_16090 [Methanosarcina sp.]|nr:hypothetical protein [Methanosarcina sp.]
MSLIQQEKIKPTLAMDKAYYLRLCNLLLLPFNRQEAYKLGIIDRDGNQIKEPSNAAEHAAYTELHQLAYGLKKLILKQPGGTSLLRSTALALNSLNKIKNRRLEPKEINHIVESFDSHRKFAEENHLRCMMEEIIIEEFVRKLEEDDATSAPAANNTSGVAGLELPMTSTFKRKPQDGSDSKTV